MKKLFIIGGGPAGISAALYAKRANIDTSVIYKDETSLSMAHKIDNYYGCPGISGTELYANGINQAKDLGINMYKEEVLSVEISDKYIIVTKDNTYEADALIIATGSYRNKPNIKNIADYEGRGVSYCAVCDGFFYRKKRLAVLGNSSYALHEADYLNNLASEVNILTNGLKTDDDELNKYNVIDKKIAYLSGENKIEKVVFEDGTELETDGLFVAIGSAGSVDLAKKLGLAVDNNKIEVNENMETNMPGIYAIGDCTDGLMQIAKAVYDGAMAANSAIRYLNK